MDFETSPCAVLDSSSPLQATRNAADTSITATRSIEIMRLNMVVLLYLLFLQNSVCVVFVEFVATLGAELRRVGGILRNPSALIAAEG